jgi:hypothetical protein
VTVVEAVTRRERSHRFADTDPRQRLNLVSLLVIVVYVSLGVVAFWPLFPDFSSKLFGTGGDSILAMWMLAWVPHSLSHGLNPLFSHAIFAPFGVNLAQNTEAPLLGLLTAPLALIMGPVARANLLMVLAMPASSTAAFIVLRKWKVWVPAAALGGLVYGFSPYALGHSLGHVVLVFLPLPPFIAYVFVSILQHRGSPGRHGLALGLLLVGQFLCEMEVFTTVVLLLGLATVFLALKNPKRIREVASYSLRPLGIAVGIVVFFLSYPVWLMLAGPEHYTGTAQPFINPYYNDLLGFVDPGSLQKFSFGLRGLKGPASNPAETGGFIGIPVLIIVGYFAFRSRRSARMQMALALLVGSAVLSLGRHLSLNGTLTRLPLPFVVLAHLPLLENILPVRFSLEVAAFVGAVIAFGLDDIYKTSNRSQRSEVPRQSYVAVFWAVVALATVVVTQFPTWPYTAQPVVVLPSEILSAIPSGDPIALTYPYASPVAPQPMMWQAEAGFPFRLVGGYAEHPDVNGKPTGFPNPLNPPGIEGFLAGQEGYNPYLPPVPVTPELLASTQLALSSNNIQIVLVDSSAKGAGPVVDLFTQLLGSPSVSEGHFQLWLV